MKVTTTIAAIVGTLAVLLPLSSASQPVVERGTVALHDADVEARDTFSCQARSERHHKKHRKKNKAKHVGAKVSSVSASQINKQKKINGSKRPSNYIGTHSRPTYTRPKAVSTSQPNTGSSTTVETSTGSSGSTSGTSGSSSSSTLSNFDQTMLTIHNDDRAKHAASPLTWDATLASAAAKWAAGCKWQHTPNNPYGQNIAAGTASNFGARDAADSWYNEISQYNFAAGQYSDSTGHFTQMVWKGSKKLGCAIQECTASQMGLGSQGKAQYVVCNYDPPGNVIGNFLQNVLAS